MPVEVVLVAAIPTAAIFLCWAAYLIFGLVVFLKTGDPQALQHVGTMARSFRIGSIHRQAPNPDPAAPPAVAYGEPHRPVDRNQHQGVLEGAGQIAPSTTADYGGVDSYRR